MWSFFKSIHFKDSLKSMFAHIKLIRLKFFWLLTIKFQIIFNYFMSLVTSFFYSTYYSNWEALVGIEPTIITLIVNTLSTQLPGQAILNLKSNFLRSV